MHSSSRCRRSGKSFGDVCSTAGLCCQGTSIGRTIASQKPSFLIHGSAPGAIARLRRTLGSGVQGYGREIQAPRRSRLPALQGDAGVAQPDRRYARLVFASNFPVDKLYSDFDTLYAAFREITKHFSVDAGIIAAAQRVEHYELVQAGQQSGDRINADFDPVDVDAGKSGCLFVAAHGNDLFSQSRVAHQQEGQRRDRQGQEHRRRNAGHVAGKDGTKRWIDAVNGLASGEVVLV